MKIIIESMLMCQCSIPMFQCRCVIVNVLTCQRGSVTVCQDVRMSMTVCQNQRVHLSYGKIKHLL